MQFRQRTGSKALLGIQSTGTFCNEQNAPLHYCFFLSHLKCSTSNLSQYVIMLRRKQCPHTFYRVLVISLGGGWAHPARSGPRDLVPHYGTPTVCGKTQEGLGPFSHLSKKGHPIISKATIDFVVVVRMNHPVRSGFPSQEIISRDGEARYASFHQNSAGWWVSLLCYREARLGNLFCWLAKTNTSLQRTFINVFQSYRKTVTIWFNYIKSKFLNALTTA